MFPARTLYLLPFALVGAALVAEEPKPAEKPAEAKEIKVEIRTEAKAETACKDSCRPSRRVRFHRHSHSHSTFSAYAQGVVPLRELGASLDERTGYGLGVQWTRDRGDWHASRTRLEWNTFPEGPAVNGVKTYAKNYTLSWDHLFKLNKGGTHAYLVAGIGGTRWFTEQTAPGFHASRWTTKPAISGGVGVQLASRVNLEARYTAGSLDKTFDANTMMASLAWRF